MKQKTKFLFSLFVVLAFVVFAGTSCDLGNTENSEEESTEDDVNNDSADATDEDVDLDEFCADTGSSAMKPNGDIICEGRDSGLLGNWQLESQTVAGSSLRLAGSPPSVDGRMLTFYNETQSYMEDYSAEKFEKVEVTTPDGDASEQCHSTGSNTGAYYVTFEVDDSDAIQTTLEVNRDANLDPEGIKSICDEGPGELTVEGSASVPLGTGAVSSSCDGNNFLGGPCLKYSYSISDDGSLLTIKTTSGPSVTYTFRRR